MEICLNKKSNYSITLYSLNILSLTFAPNSYEYYVMRYFALMTFPFVGVEIIVSQSAFSAIEYPSSAEAKYTTSKSEDRRIWTYDLDEPLESHKQYKAYAKVTFERKDGDKWVPVPSIHIARKGYCHK